MTQNLKKNIIKALLLGLFAYIGYLFFQFMLIGNEKGECGMAVGPIYGTPINIVGTKLKVEQYFKIPEGRIGFMNLDDSLPPKMIKFGPNNEVIWAIEFTDPDSHGIPFNKVSKMKLEKGNSGFVFKFFNYSYSEPGAIYVDENYNFPYMCLSPF